MVKKKGSGKKTASVKTRTVYKSAPHKRRASMGYDKIAPAVATVALVAVNKDNIKGVVNAVTNNGSARISEYPSRIINNKWTAQQLGRFVNMNQIATDAIAIAGGYVAGEAFNKFAPTFLKKPIARLSKKIPRVI